jgi:hypothetical protein
MLNTNNFINIDLDIKDQYIYRIISVERLIELFKNKQNVLVSPKKWEDPFENFILNAKAKLPDGEIVDFGFRDDFYGQCWTRHKASDAMWRIYSPESNGVRIRTTIQKLAHSLASGLQPWQNVRCFIGKVKYLNNKKMMEFANTVFKGKINPEAYEVAKTLLIKRPAFKHENEVRLLYFKNENECHGSIYKYDIDPHNLIDQIMIDPRLDYDQFKKVKENIKTKTNFKDRILRSLLYSPPKNMVFPFGL